MTETQITEFLAGLSQLIADWRAEDPQPDLRTQLIAETRALEAQVDTCEHSLHRSPIGCPYCKRDTRFIALLRAAAAALAVPSPQLKKEEEALTRRDSLPLTETPQPAPSGWMPIETAPKDGSVLYVVAKVTSNQEPAVMWAYWNQRLQWWYRFAAKEPTRIYPTLFAPLPSPPQETV